MNTLNIGLIGCGTVGSGVLKIIQNKGKVLQKDYGVNLNLVKICDRSFRPGVTKGLRTVQITKNINDITHNNDIDVVIELIGGLNPARDIAFDSLKNGKHLVTANKELIAHHGIDLFKTAVRYQRNIYFESAVGAGVPMISMIENGLAGNNFKNLYGIVNGTCNYILTEMTKNDMTFNQALKSAQHNGFAESNPTLDINGMDSAHKLCILILLSMGKLIPLKDIHVEGITHISPVDIEYAKEMGLVIKLLAIAKKTNNAIEARVHPTLIQEDLPLASVNGAFNALFLDTSPLGDIILYGQGAGQMAAASGVISDLLNLAASPDYQPAIRTLGKAQHTSRLKVKKVDEIETRFYLRCMVQDKPGVLAKIAGILGRHGVSIHSVSQRRRHKKSAIPIVMLTHEAKEKMVRKALWQIQKLSEVKSHVVAIRMEQLT